MREPASGQTLTSWIWMSLVAFCCVAAVYFAWERRQQAQADLEQADLFFQQGQKAEAIEIYTARFEYLPEQRKPAILQRIVEHEVGLGHRDAAMEWIDRALEEDYPLATDVEAVRVLVDKAKQLREEASRKQPPQPPEAQEPKPASSQPSSVPKSPDPNLSAGESVPSTVPPLPEETLSERERKRLENIRRTEEAKAAAQARRPETAANMLENALHLRRLGKEAEAAKWLRKVVEDYPETEAAKEAQKRLETKPK